MATAKPAVGTAVNFGDNAMYAGGLSVPDGDYVVKSMDVMMWAGFSQTHSSPPRLGVMVEWLPLSDPKEENVVKSFYSMGSKADQSFAPNPETGKGLIAIPGAAGQTLQLNTNWDIFRKSWLQTGMPPGIFTNDLSVFEGAHVHIQNQDEPEERKGYASATAEVAGEPRRVNKIAVVTEIKEGGAPWEGGGGIPVNGTAKKALAKPVAKVTPKVTPKTVPVATNTDEDTATAAAEAISAVLEANPNGIMKLKLGTETFKSVKSSVSEEMAAAVAEMFFKGEGAAENLANLVGEWGYVIAGPMVKPAA